LKTGWIGWRTTTMDTEGLSPGKVSKPAAKLLELLKRLSKKTGIAWASTEWLARTADKSTRSVQVYLRELRRSGVIDKVAGGYRIVEKDLYSDFEASAEPAPKSAETAPKSAETAPKSAETAHPTLDDFKSYLKYTPLPPEKFDLTPEGLAQQFCMHSCSMAIRDRNPYIIAPIFADLIQHGIPAKEILFHIRDPSRLKSEYFFEFRRRLLEGRNGKRISRIGTPQRSLNIVEARTIRVVNTPTQPEAEAPLPSSGETRHPFD